MKTTDLFSETVTSFSTNRVRSSIIVIGIVIGIATIISMSAVLGGVQRALIGDEEFSQERLITIVCNSDRPLNFADAEDMSKKLEDEFELVMPVSYGAAEVSSSSKKVLGLVEGVHAEYASVLNQNMVQGRSITQEEYDTSDVVVMLDEMGAKALFGTTSESVVGQKVNIQGTDYQVVGVMTSDGTSGDTETISVYMPFTTCARRVVGNTEVNTLLALVRENVEPEKASYEAEKWLMDRLKISESEKDAELYIRTMKTIVDRVKMLMRAMQMLVVLLSSIALLVGGIGIMEIMLTNVAERTREIGLRKALGASDQDISIQFLLEAVGLTFGGGVIGFLFGYLLSFGLSSIAGVIISLGEGVTITPTIGIETVLLVVGICLAIGIVFGFYPAYRAGKLDPVEPLRYQ